MVVEFRVVVDAFAVQWPPTEARWQSPALWAGILYFIAPLFPKGNTVHELGLHRRDKGRRRIGQTRKRIGGVALTPGGFAH
jgi:hypothetical protein